MVKYDVDETVDVKREANIKPASGYAPAGRSRVIELEESIREREERIGQWSLFVKSAELKGRNLKSVEQVIQNIQHEQSLLEGDRSKLLKLTK